MTNLTSTMPLIFIAVGLLCLVFGVLTVVRDRGRRRSWRTYPGRVVQSRLADGQVRSRVSYERDGREHSFWNRYTSTTGGDPVGREVQVLVNPDDPDDALVSRGLAGGGAFGLALIAFGVVALLAGAFVLR